MKTRVLIIVTLLVFFGFFVLAPRDGTKIKDSNLTKPIPPSDSSSTVIPAFDGKRDVPGYPNRPYMVHIPERMNQNVSFPVILAIHGGGANAEHMKQLTCPGGNLNSPECLDRFADRESFIIVYPNGTENPNNPSSRTFNAGGGSSGFACVSAYACAENLDDISYFKTLLLDLKSFVNVIPGRIYATGLSNGAAMSHRLACELSDEIKAIASVGGANQFAAVSQCSPNRAISILHIHGDKDPAWVYGGGLGGGYEAGNFVSVSNSLSGWVVRNGCNRTPTVENPIDTDPNDGTKVERITYPNCSQESEVVHYKIIGGGHTWPQGWQYVRASKVGKTSLEISANKLLIDFFKKH